MVNKWFNDLGQEGSIITLNKFVETALIKR